MMDRLNTLPALYYLMHQIKLFTQNLSNCASHLKTGHYCLYLDYM